MNCPKCGQPTDPGATFCGNCGQSLQPVALITQPAVFAQPQPLPPQTTGMPVAVAPSPVVQNVSPIAQVMVNQPMTPPPAIGSFGNPAASAVGASGMAPAYAVQAISTQGSGETRATIGLVLGIIGIPASLIPIAGMICGITGLVLGTTARARYKHTLSLLAIIFSSLAIVTALCLWVYGIEHYVKAHDKSGATSSGTSSASANSSANRSLMPITTPCYNVTIDSGLNNYKPTGCDFDSASTSQEYTVEATANADVTAANLAQYGRQALLAGAKGINGTVTSQQSGQFAGSPAYIGYINGPNNQKGELGVVLHQTVNQQNVFLVAHFVQSDQKVDFGSLETNWQWE
jgi:hypothetical protein